MLVNVEKIFDALQLKMKERLAVRLEEANTLNSDFYIEPIADDAWIEGSLNEQVANFNQVCFYFIDDLQSIVNGPMVVSTIAIEFDLIISTGNDLMDYKRMLRYQYALMQAASDSWGKVGVGHDKATITALNPIDVKLFNSSNFSKVIGIRFEFNLLN